MKTSKQQNYSLLAAVLATFSALLLSTSMLLARTLSPAIPTPLVVFIKSCCGLGVLIPLLVQSKLQMLSTNKIHLHLLRVILSASSMLCTYYAYRNLPTVVATAIGMTGALFVTILARIILAEKIRPLKWLLISIGYLGVILVIAKPTSISYTLSISYFAVCSAILANIFAASCVIVTKLLSHHDTPTTIVTYSNLGVTLIYLMLSYNNLSIITTISTKDIITLFSIGILVVIAHICSVSAVKHTSPAFTAPFEYTRIVFAAIVGVTLFNEPLTLLVIIGSSMIILSAYLLNFLATKD